MIAAAQQTSDEKCGLESSAQNPHEHWTDFGGLGWKKKR